MPFFAAGFLAAGFLAVGAGFFLVALPAKMFSQLAAYFFVEPECNTVTAKLPRLMCLSMESEQQ